MGRQKPAQRSSSRVSLSIRASMFEAPAMSGPHSAPTSTVTHGVAAVSTHSSLSPWKTLAYSICSALAEGTRAHDSISVTTRTRAAKEGICLGGSGGGDRLLRYEERVVVVVVAVVVAAVAVTAAKGKAEGWGMQEKENADGDALDERRRNADMEFADLRPSDARSR